MSIFLNNSGISAIKLGNNNVSKIFLGDNLVFESCPDSTSSVKMTGWVYGDRTLSPIGYAPYGRETYTYGDETVRYETGVWLYINTGTELARAYSYAAWPWLVDWPSPYAAVKICASAPPLLWNPSYLGSGVSLWLDASDLNTVILNGPSVSQWDDKSIAGRDVSQNVGSLQPLYVSQGLNGQPTVSFDGINDYLEATSVATTVAGNDTPFSVLAVVNYSVRGVVQRAVNFGSTTDTSIFHTVFGLDTTGRQVVQRRSAGGSLVAQIATGSIAGENRIIGSVFDGTNVSIYLDGTLTRTGVLDTEIFSPNTFTIGAFKRTFISDYSQMNMSELLLVSSTISDTDRQKLEGYLAHKWGLVANLPINHPYKNSAP
jgi:hypothetical protein